MYLKYHFVYRFPDYAPLSAPRPMRSDARLARRVGVDRYKWHHAAIAEPRRMR